MDSTLRGFIAGILFCITFTCFAFAVIKILIDWDDRRQAQREAERSNQRHKVVDETAKHEAAMRALRGVRDD